MDACQACGAAGELHDHHVVPRSILPNDFTVRLCERCHGIVHNRPRMSVNALTAAAMAHKAAVGEYTGGRLPYGKRLADDGVRLVDNPAELAVIATARELHAAGLSLRAVAAELARSGHLSRTGRVFDHKAVAAMVAAPCDELEGGAYDPA